MTSNNINNNSNNNFNNNSNNNNNNDGNNNNDFSLYTQQINILLSNTQSQTNQIRSNAENELRIIAESHFSRFLLALCHTLSSSNEQQSVRVAAGLYLKNLVGGESARSEEKLNEIRERWINQSQELREQIKINIVKVLELPDREARNTAANVIANLVAVETLQEWQNLVPNLLAKSQSEVSNGQQQTNFDRMHSVLLCLGRIAEDSTTHEGLQPHSSDILQLIARGMSSTNAEVQASAMQCLYHMMDFIRTNMAEQADRDVILQMICMGSTNASNAHLRLNSMMAMSRLCETYYDFLAPYMQSIFGITKNIIESGVLQQREDTDITKQAIEVWSVTAEMEAYIDDTNAYQNNNEAGSSTTNNTNTTTTNNNNNNTTDPGQKAAETTAGGGSGVRQNFGFVNKVLNTLVPIYLQALMLQNVNFDDDEWDIRKAAGCSLELFAHVAKANILKEVLSFVEKNITDENWRAREAALCAFGYVLEGPPADDNLLGLVSQIMPVVVHMMTDNNKHVQATATWTFGRICKHVPKAIGDKDIISNVTLALRESNSVASKACWCIASLSVYYGENSTSLPASMFSSPKKTFDLMTAILTRAEREDSDGHLITSAHEALNSIIYHAPKQANDMIKSLLPELVNRLTTYTNKSNKTDTDMFRIAAIMTSIQVAINTTGVGCLDMNLANDIMTCSCKMAQSNHELVFEEILVCMTAVSAVIETNFFNYLTNIPVQKLLLSSIDINNGQNNSQLCQTGAATIGDVFRACGPVISEVGGSSAGGSGTAGGGNGGNCSRDLHLQIQSFTDKAVEYLLLCLLSQELEMVCKPHVIDALVDISLAHGQNSGRYCNQITSQCLELGGYDTPEAAASDPELMDILNELRVSIAGVCRTAIFEYTDTENMGVFEKFLPAMLTFFGKCAIDGNIEALNAMFHLMKEMAELCPMSTIMMLRVNEVTQIFDKVKNIDDTDVRQTAVAAFNALKAR